MKSINFLFCVVVLYLAAPMVSAQTESATYEKFRLLLVDGNRLEGIDGVVSSGTLVGESTKGEQLSIPTSDIRAMDRYAGNQAGKWALIGGGIGLGTAVLAYIGASAEAASDPYKEVNSSAVLPVFAVLTGSGALIGMLVGSSMVNWERVPVSGLQARLSIRNSKIVFTLNF
jgi:hypothetical protein